MNEKYTPALRRKILDRDRSRCQFPIYDEEKGWRFCGSTDRVQVHHISPQRWSEFFMLEADCNEFANLITLCFYHHQSEIHPDMIEARHNYGIQKSRGIEKPNSYQQVFNNRDELIREGETYWNTDYDEFFSQRAEEQSGRIEVRFGKLYISGKFIRNV